jgi:signal transduction histidine kinase
MFEPLVTAKPRGTGLGLALSRTIIEAHGGEITSTTGSRQGTAFRMWLPNEGAPAGSVGIMPPHAD